MLQPRKLIFVNILIVAVAWSSAGGWLVAQDLPAKTNPQNESNATNPTPAVQPESPAGNPPLSPGLGDGLFVIGPDGKPLKVFAGADFADFQKWLEQRAQPPADPAYAFSDVSLEGTANETVATLKAKLTVQITRDGQWVRVPVELNEANLQKFTHAFQPLLANSDDKTTGKAAFAGLNRQGGNQWWFFGAGQHTLTLDFVVAVRKSAGVRRLQLSVPQAASSYLKLDLPIANEQLAFEPLSLGVQKTTPLSKDATQIELFRLGPRLDFGWKTLPDSRQVKTLLKAESELRVEPTEESILLKARQLIEPLQGSLKDIEITPPGGFTILELKLDGESYQPVANGTGSGKAIKISLPAPSTNRVRLDWILQAPWPTSGQLIIEGFNVEDCLRQSGEIAIAGYEGYRIVKRSATDVYRTNVRELLGPGPVLSAYQFRQQPFQLVLDLQPIEPTYSIRPHLFLKMGAKQIEMMAELELEIYRGVLESLQIDWPGFSEQGWIIDRTELPGLVEDVEIQPASGKITFSLAKRLGQGTQFRFNLKATRKVESVPKNGLELSLPRALASNPVRSVVVVTHEENVESTMTAVEGTETQPLSATFAEEVDTLLNQPRLRAFRGPRQTGFMIRSELQSFQAKLITHPQNVKCETQIKVVLADDRVDVTENLNYDVKYERLSQLRVMVPRSFPEQTAFFADGVPLTYEWTGLETGNSRQARLTLPSSKLGAFYISAEFSLPYAASEDRQVVVPCVRASDAQELSGRLEFEADYPSQVTLKESAWKLAQQQETRTVWTSKLPGETVSLRWSPRTESDIQRLQIPRALVRYAIQQNGHIISQAYYQIDENTDQVLIHLPPDQMVPTRFQWGGVELTDKSQIREAPAGSGTYRLTRPRIGLLITEESNTEAAPSRLVVSYHSRETYPMNWQQTYRLPTPDFPGEVWIDQTLWEIALPMDQHLFLPPTELTPEFSWVRQGAFWSRTAHPATVTFLEEFGLTSSTAEDDWPMEGNRYFFSIHGASPVVQFSAMNRSIIVLLGAGIALLCGFMLLKIPFTRNVLTLLCLAFAFAVCSVWYLAPMQLLLQPAVLGLLLALAAVSLDGSLKRDRMSHGVPISGSGEYPGSSMAQPMASYPDMIGSEDPTAVRNTPVGASDSSPDPLRVQQKSTASQPPELIGSSISERPE